MAHSLSLIHISSGLTVAGHIGTWHTIDRHEVGGHSVYLMEHDTYGDEAACIIVDERGKLCLLYTSSIVG